MVITILSWIYIFIISLACGRAVNRLLSKLIQVPSYETDRHFGITGLVVTGLVTLTVFAEVFSIFYKVGAVCHLVMLALVAAGGFLYKNEVKGLLDSVLNRWKSFSVNAKLVMILI